MRLRLTLLVAVCGGVDPFWQQDGVGLAYADVSTDAHGFYHSGCPNVCQVFGLDAQGSMALHAGSHRGPGLDVRTVYFVQPYRTSRDGDPLVFRALLRGLGVGMLPTSRFSGRFSGEWAGGGAAMAEVSTPTGWTWKAMRPTVSVPC